MKYFIPFFLFGIILISCEKDFSPLGLFPEQSVALKTGNIFYYHEYSSGQLADSVWVVSEWFLYDNVIGDTLILNRKYFILNHSTLRRADKDRFYGFENSKEVTLLNYDIQIGDTVDFYNSRVIVEDIGKKQVFNRHQTVVSVSSKKLNSDTLITGTYTKQFGLLSYSKGYGKISHGSTLSGSIINGIQFGVIH